MAKAGPNFTPHLLIDGTSRAALSGETFDLRHPATGAQIGKIPLAGPADVDAAIAAARTAFDDGPWRQVTPADRALDRKSTRLNSSHPSRSRMPSSA